MTHNFFLPSGIHEFGDVALLKTLREYQRARMQFDGQDSPAFYSLREQIAVAIRTIEEELERRGRTTGVYHC